jgi:subtilase family serine protease
MEQTEINQQREQIAPDQDLNQAESSENEMIYTTQGVEDDLRREEDSVEDTEGLMTTQQVSVPLDGTSNGNNIILIGGITIAFVLAVVVAIVLAKRAKS